LKHTKAENFRNGKLRVFFLVSLLLLIFSCSSPKEVKGKPEEFFLKNYERGVYRYVVLENKQENADHCRVHLRDLIKEKEYILTLSSRYRVEKEGLRTKLYCELFSKGRFLEVAGENFTPPSALKIVTFVKLNERLYLWFLERVRSGGGGGGVIFLPLPIPWGGGGYDYGGRYETPTGRYGK